MIPKTKDGKHEVLFPLDFFHIHGLELRAALEGRVIWTLTQLNKGKIKRLEEKYEFPRYERRYPDIKDPEKLFENITVPHVGRVNPTERKVVIEKGFHRGSEGFEGDDFIQPFAPITCYFDPEKYEFGSLGFRIFTRDSPPLKTGFIFRDSHSERKTLEQVPEVLTLYNSLFEQGEWAKLDEAIRKDSLEEIIRKKDTNRLLKSLSRFYVLNSLYKSNILLNEEVPERLLSHYDEDNHHGYIFASVPLTKKIAESGAALCNEYLSEMK